MKTYSNFSKYKHKNLIALLIIINYIILTASFSRASIPQHVFVIGQSFFTQK